jgi:hypothetical protein
MNDFFFSLLKENVDFNIFCEDSDYQKLPVKWYVFVVDVSGSTKAIAEGKYKSVNSVGVSAIAAVLNVAQNIAIPYIFGGDGATFCVPESLKEKVKIALLGTKKMAMEAFDLMLIVGAISIEEIRASGYEINVGKYRVSDHYKQAIFSGGGLTFAENCIKDETLGYRLEIAATIPAANFEGFECRWKNIPSRYGETVAYLIKVVLLPNDKKLYSRLLDQFDEIYGDSQKRHPLTPRKMKLSFNFRQFQNEFRIKTYFSKNKKDKYLWRMLVQNLIGAFSMFFKLRYKEMSWGKYKYNAIENSDVCKFDDILRLVVSGTARQREEMELFLEKNYKAGELAYGLHVSNAATMTCYVKDYVHDHYHFVDGADGGYALASVDFKRRIKTLEIKK